MSADLLTTVEAAKTLGLSPGTLCNWRNFKRGPKFVKVRAGNRVLVRYRKADLEAYSIKVSC